MSEEHDHAGAVYDRQLLLAGRLRSEVLTLEQVRQHGRDNFADADYVSVYGMLPVDWYAAGMRLLGRTTVECTRDALADAIAVDIASVAGSRPAGTDLLVVDPFVGSGNTLYWMLRRMPGARGLGFERDSTVFELTRRDLTIRSSPLEVLNTDYVVGLDRLALNANQAVIVFIAPPWGDALDVNTGLDLRRTSPPVDQIVDGLIQHFGQTPLLVAVQIFERTDPASMTEVESRFDRSSRRLYDLNSAGQNHGLVLCTRGW